MNLNHAMIVYSKPDRAIVLLDMRLDVLSRRVAHQEAMDALVQYMINEQPPFCEQRINSNGKNYILRVTPCK